MATRGVIGKPVPRTDGPDKVTGSARYAVDVVVPGTLWMKTLASPFPHARITRIDTSAAEELAGVHAVITGKDVVGGLYGRFVRDIPALAFDRVRFVGDRVAAVAAVDPDVARQAVDLIEVEYEELPATFDPREATSPEAPLLHPDMEHYQGIQSKPDINNTYLHTVVERGDPDWGFDAADFIIENTYTTQRVHQAYFEPHSCTMQVREDGIVEIWASTKVPYNAREALAIAIGLPEDRIILHPVMIGGDFGGKGTPLDLPVCYYLALRTGRPVKMVKDYTEELTAGNPRHEVFVTLKTGVRASGEITAHQVHFLVNAGAYAGYKPRGMIGGATEAAGPYRVANCRIESLHVYTNTVPGGYMRGPGEPQAVFALESHIDEIAQLIGIDPLDFRRLNLVAGGEESAAGDVFPDARVKETLEAAASASGYGTPKPDGVGRGIAVGYRAPGGGKGTAAVSLNPDGTATLATPIFDQGTGTYTTLAQVVSEEFDIPIEKVGIEVWDTTSVPFDSGVAGSRTTRVNTVAAYEAVMAARKSLCEAAAQLLGWPSSAIVCEAGILRRTDTEESQGWQEVVSERGEAIVGRASVDQMMPAGVTGYSAQVAEVSVDRETGQVILLRFTTAHDVGMVVNPVGHQGQINGAVVQGIGYALMEELRVEDGQVTTATFGDFKIPSMEDIPPLRTVLLEGGAGVGPYGIKGIGEGPIAPVAPAIANAVADAVGVRVRVLPITAERVFSQLQSQTTG